MHVTFVCYYIQGTVLPSPLAYLMEKVDKILHGGIDNICDHDAGEVCVSCLLYYQWFEQQCCLFRQTPKLVFKCTWETEDSCWSTRCFPGMNIYVHWFSCVWHNWYVVDASTFIFIGCSWCSHCALPALEDRPKSWRASGNPEAPAAEIRWDFCSREA